MKKSVNKEAESKKDIHTQKSIHEYDEMIERENNDINDKAAKRLLKQEQLTPIQIGRLEFLNLCEMTLGHKQLYSSEQYLQMQYKLERTEEVWGKFITLQRLLNYAVNALNNLQVREDLSLTGFQYIHLQMHLIKENLDDELINPEQIMIAIQDIRRTLQYINSYALFYDAMRSILENDRRLKEAYRITPKAREVLNAAKDYDEYIKENFTQDVRKKYKLFYIGEIPRVYTEHKARAGTIKKLKKYLLDSFVYTEPVDSLPTEATSIYINSHFPRD